MSPSSAVATIGTSPWVKLGAHEMPAARAAIPTSAEDPYIVYKVAFLHSTGKAKPLTMKTGSGQERKRPFERMA